MDLEKELEHFKKLAVIKQSIYIVLFISGLLLLFASPYVGLAFIVISIIGSVYDKDIRFFKRFYKEMVYRKVYNRYFENVDYRPEMDIDESVVKKTGLIPMAVVFCTDYLKATYNDKSFSSVYVSSKTAGKNRVTYFDGVLVSCDLAKPTEAYIYIKRKQMLSSEKPENNFVQYQKYVTGNQQFDNDYAVYTNDLSIVDEYITDEILENIMLIDKAMKCEILYGIAHGKLYVGFSNGDAATAPSAFDDDQANMERVSEYVVRPILTVMKYFDSIIGQ